MADAVSALTRSHRAAIHFAGSIARADVAILGAVAKPDATSDDLRKMLAGWEEESDDCGNKGTRWYGEIEKLQSAINGLLESTDRECMSLFAATRANNLAEFCGVYSTSWHAVVLDSLLSRATVLRNFHREPFWSRECVRLEGNGAAMLDSLKEQYAAHVGWDRSRELQAWVNDNREQLQAWLVKEALLVPRDRWGDTPPDDKHLRLGDEPTNADIDAVRKVLKEKGKSPTVLVILDELSKVSVSMGGKKLQNVLDILRKTGECETPSRRRKNG